MRNNSELHLIDFSFSSNLPADSLQRLREEIEHLKGRFTESITELETRTTFIKKTIKVSDTIPRCLSPLARSILHVSHFAHRM